MYPIYSRDILFQQPVYAHWGYEATFVCKKFIQQCIPFKISQRNRQGEMQIATDVGLISKYVV